ncbi:MAG: hypothetical protein HFACDABA_02464 [Anaerolineales bacterium]|nr:hypothetical protein [Anaerolineales bacterium]
MITHRMFTKSLLFVLALTVAVVSGVLIGSEYPNPIWIDLLFGVLLGLFIGEIVESVDNKKTAWKYFSVRDKLIVFLHHVLLLVVSLYPVKEDMSPIIVAIFLLAGSTLVWLIINSFGSEILKERMLWPKPKKI